MSACPKCGEPRPGGQRMHKCHTPANKATVETEESDPLVGGSEGFGMWDGPYETIEKLTAERDVLRECLLELKTQAETDERCGERINHITDLGVREARWERLFHFERKERIKEIEAALAATENKKNE